MPNDTWNFSGEQEMREWWISLGFWICEDYCESQDEAGVQIL